MATVIRAARIDGDAVTLAIGRQSETRPEPAQMTHVTMPMAQTAATPANAEQAVAEASVAERLHEQRMAALREQEARLHERERMLQAQLADERERVLKEAYADGYQKGEAAGAKQFDEQLHALRGVVGSLEESFSASVSSLDDVVVGIAYEAVCKIVGGAMDDAEGVLAVVRQVMSRVKEQEKLVIRVSAHDYEMICRHWNTLFKEGQDSKHELVADDRVAYGGCMVETSGGTLDGRLEIQLQQLRDTLLAARKMLPE